MRIYIYLIFCIAGKTLTTFSDLPLDNLCQYAGLWNILFSGRCTQVEKTKAKEASDYFKSSRKNCFLFNPAKVVGICPQAGSQSWISKQDAEVGKICSLKLLFFLSLVIKKFPDS